MLASARAERHFVLTGPPPLSAAKAPILLSGNIIRHFTDFHAYSAGPGGFVAAGQASPQALGLAMAVDDRQMKARNGDNLLYFY